MVPRTPIAPSAAAVNFGIGLTMVLVGCAFLGVAAALLFLQPPVLYAKEGRYEQLLLSALPMDPRKKALQLCRAKEFQQRNSTSLY